MKKMKKIFALLIAMVMVLGMSTSVFAGSITITRDDTYAGSDGRTYTAYKVFDADTTLTGSNSQGNKQPTYTENGPIAYSMATNSPWLSAMQDAGQTWFDVKLASDGSKYVVTPLKQKNEDGTERDLNDSDAAAIAAYLKSNLPTGLTGTTVTPGTAATVDNGYYVILASDGATNVTLVTTDVNIVEKNTYIETNKTTAETSYNVGDIVSYQATVKVPSDASLTDPIILHDKMDSVLDFKKNVAATMDGAAFTEFTTSYDEDAAALKDDCTFEITIPVTNAILGKTIIFTYTAEVTSAAADPDTGLVNTLFGEKNGYKTTPSTPKVYTFDFDFSKEFVGSTDTSLTATFELYTAEEYAKMTDDDDTTTATALTFVAGTGAGKYIKADTNDSGSATITSANNAKINVEGLKAGTYYLVEKTTSTGYNMLDKAVPVVITDTTDKTAANWTPSHTVTVDGKTSTEQSPVAIQNQKGSVLPSTGGIGTTIFYIIGAILVIGAGVVLVTRRRMNAD